MYHDVIEYYVFFKDRLIYLVLPLIRMPPVPVPEQAVPYIVLERQRNKAEDIQHEEVQERDEVDVIGHADAIVQPRAMVVHSFDTPVADIAVLGPWRFDD